MGLHRQADAGRVREAVVIGVARDDHAGLRHEHVGLAAVVGEVAGVVGGGPGAGAALGIGQGQRLRVDRDRAGLLGQVAALLGSTMR